MAATILLLFVLIQFALLAGTYRYWRTEISLDMAGIGIVGRNLSSMANDEILSRLPEGWRVRPSSE